MPIGGNPASDASVSEGNTMDVQQSTRMRTAQPHYQGMGPSGGCSSTSAKVVKTFRKCKSRSSVGVGSENGRFCVEVLTE